jgi:hypothetical protein
MLVMKKTLKYTPWCGECDEFIIREHIVRFSKSDDGDITYIHLTTGEKIAAKEDIYTLEARYKL